MTLRLREVGSDLHGFLASLDADPALLEDVEGRLERISDLKRRFGGASFDESSYARAAAEQLHVDYTEVEYGEAESLAVLGAIACMEVPFCDAGIEVGTWIMARAATGRVDYVLTGDGGDEIWASHPAYAAQRLLAPYDLLPLVVRRALVARVT